MKTKARVWVVVTMVICLFVLGIVPGSAIPELEWNQVNVGGFGTEYIYHWGVSALEEFKGDLYGGTSYWDDPYTLGASVWRWDGGSDWSNVSGYGFGSDQPNSTVTDLEPFSGMLYAGVTDWAGTGFPGQVWRTADGTSWEAVIPDGFDNPDNFGVTMFTKFSGETKLDTDAGISGDEGYFYAAAANDSGAEVWRSATGDPGTWEQVFKGSEGVYQVTGFASFKGDLYLALESFWDPGYSVQVWRSATGDLDSWEPITLDGFGDPNNKSTGGLAIFRGYLYVGLLNYDESLEPEYPFPGGQLWRSRTGDPGGWEPVTLDGFGNPNNIKIESLYRFMGRLFAITYNEITGVEVWVTHKGQNWDLMSDPGFGKGDCNWATLWSNATVATRDGLFVGTWNYCEGGEIWLLSKLPPFEK